MDKMIIPSIKEVVFYENDQFLFKAYCNWPDSSITRDIETGLLKVRFFDNKQLHCRGLYTLALPDGRRITRKDFHYLGDFKEGLCKVSISGNIFGFINENAKFVIPCKYDYAYDFNDGLALVSIRDNIKNFYKQLFINKEGKEYHFEKDYEYINEHSDGMFRVTIKDMIHDNFVYNSDYQKYAGIWGYVDSTGKEIIKPQYIYAFDFQDGLAIVCKGEWIKNKRGRYYSEEEKWGIIDKTGKEVVPCIYDEIERFNNNTKYFQVHSGGWENGKWGVMNCKGEWVVEPIFEEKIDIDNDEYINNSEQDTEKNSFNIVKFDDNGKYGLMFDGNIILPNRYDYIEEYDNIFIAEDEHGSTLYKIEKKEK